MRNADPNPEASLEPLEEIFWDYNYDLTGKELYDFVLGKQDVPGLDRDMVKARVLMTVGWYRLVDIFGLRQLKLLMDDNTLKRVWVDELRAQYALARKVIQRTVP